VNAIETRDLTKFYGQSRGIIDLNLSIGEGEIYGFIGPNGAGKSTSIRLFLNLLFPTRGSGHIFGLDIVKDSPAIKQIVGFVPSEVHYYDKMKVLELLQYSARFFGTVLDNEHLQIAEKLELDTSRRIEALSMGNKKKVAVVQSLIHRPRLLILDEPTSGLDPLMQNRFFEILNEVNQNGTTIFFSSHILAEVQKFCHRVAIIKEGKIVDEEDIISMREKSLSRITYHLNVEEPVGFPELPGMISVEHIERGATFLYRGDIPFLLSHLQKLPIDKLTVTEPDLEEVFMHYYKETSEKEANQ
jgi:ABC-2 type transport system ATP-binding protein